MSIGSTDWLLERNAQLSKRLDDTGKAAKAFQTRFEDTLSKLEVERGIMRRLREELDVARNERDCAQFHADNLDRMLRRARGDAGATQKWYAAPFYKNPREGELFDNRGQLVAHFEFLEHAEQAADAYNNS